MRVTSTAGSGSCGPPGWVTFRPTGRSGELSSCGAGAFVRCLTCDSCSHSCSHSPAQRRVHPLRRFALLGQQRRAVSSGVPHRDGNSRSRSSHAAPRLLELVDEVRQLRQLSTGAIRTCDRSGFHHSRRALATTSICSRRYKRHPSRCSLPRRNGLASSHRRPGEAPVEWSAPGARPAPGTAAPWRTCDPAPGRRGE